MDLDEALERVMVGEIVQREGWSVDEVIVKFWAQGGQTGWRTTRMITCPDMVADDWKVVGRLQ